MRRDLTIRCVSTGTVRTDGPDSAHCVLREVSLELDGAPAHVRIVDSWERRRDTAIQLDRILVRSGAGYDIALPTPDARKPLDWLIAIAESMKEGERLTVSLWVRSMDPAALLNVAPVSVRDFSRMRAHVFDEEEGTAASPPPARRLRLIPAAS